MKKMLCALSALAVMSVWTQALALPVSYSEAAEPIRVVSSLSPEQQRSRDLATRVIALTLPDLEKQIMAFVSRVTEELGMAEGYPEMASWFEKNAGPMMMPHLRRMLDETAVLYAERFTVAELEAMIAFYDNPVGREIARKNVALQLDMAESTQTMQLNYMQDFMGAFCKQFDCGPGYAPADTKSGRR